WRAVRGSARVLAQTDDWKRLSVTGANGFSPGPFTDWAGRVTAGEAEPVHFRARLAKTKRQRQKNTPGVAGVVGCV
ncbi:MAG: hypothetical protein ACKOS8_09180, partial [Gemmataceae bacterium]